MWFLGSSVHPRLPNFMDNVLIWAKVMARHASKVFLLCVSSAAGFYCIDWFSSWRLREEVSALWPGKQTHRASNEKQL